MTVDRLSFYFAGEEVRLGLVREFDIENEKGQRFSLMNIENGCFLNSPRRIGIFL